ncbi:metallophosphoesterase family protein [Sorangium sp. So ce385]|uniref:metallophosphoesterase family protein n=1 Tax=Sorangium sp. So ce385 TaxID=3133308 RepID=UPI003F5B6B11
MLPPTRFLHTADWQLGLRASFIPGDAGAVVRNERLRTLHRIGSVARETKAEFIVVAGDVFEDHGLRPETLRRSFEAMTQISVPIYLLPGNHDPLSSDSIYRGDLWQRECPRHVHVFSSREPVIVREGVALLGCPLLERQTLGDVTEHLTPELGPRGHVRIGVAHGGIKEILERLVGDDEPLNNAIPADRAARARLDYLALGDWHGLLRIDDRTWYSGTPEATKFKEKNPGNVLAVEIDAPGAVPRVTPYTVAGLEWKKAELRLDGDAELAVLQRLLDGFARKDTTLLELTLTGRIDASVRARLDAEILDNARDRFRFLRVRDEQLQTFLGEADLATLPTEGWLGQAVARLRGEIEGTSELERSRALRLLHYFHEAVS